MKVIAVPSLTVVPSAGAVIETDGAPLTVTVITSDAGNPPESVTEAVMVWVPTDKVAFTEPPVPRAPSSDDVHERLAAKSPSSGSEAVPVKETAEPSLTVAPSAGLVIVAEGVLLV